MSDVKRLPHRDAAPYKAPTFSPIYPRDSVHGRVRTAPVAWLCADGQRHDTREVCAHA